MGRDEMGQDEISQDEEDQIRAKKNQDGGIKYERGEFSRL